MSSDGLEPYRDHLAALAARHRRRSLIGRAGVDFSSNDYLGLANGPELRAIASAALARGVALGSGGSRLLRGNDPEHEALEAEAAALYGAESALFLPGGFTANAAFLATVPQRGDLIVHDELIHASAHDGMRSGRADHLSFAHNDLTAADDIIGAWRANGGKGRIWLAVESIYSMDGDLAPLEDIMALARRHEAFVLVDEAHATGVLGPQGRGLAAAWEGRDNVITLHTCGKALGVQGGLICGPRVLRDFLVNRSRAFIYATAPSPLLAAVVRGALQLVHADDDRRLRHAALVARANAALTTRCGVTTSGTHIVPVIVGSEQRAMAVAAGLQNAGFDIRGIRPPTVPVGTSRLRIAITLNVSDAIVDDMAVAVGAQLERHGP
jgi:8-amino-7-oxononanoate synthase